MGGTGASFGRRQELQRLLPLLAEARAGRGGAAWIVGEPGIGKSHLLGVLAETAREQGFAVRSGAARALESHLPFGVLVDALEISARATGPAAEAAELLQGGHASGVAGSVEFAVGELLNECLREIAEEAPLLVLLDDLQWADRASLQFLDRLLLAVRSLPLVLVCAARADHSDELTRVRTASVVDGAVDLPLERLHDGAAQRVAAAVLEAGGVAADDRLAELVSRCGGNPLLVTTLLRALMGRGEAALGGELWVDDAASTALLRPAVLGWVGQLPSETRETLVLASVLGREFALADLALLTGRPAAALWTTLRPATTAGILSSAGELLSFSHDVVHEVLYDELPVSARRAMHVDFARSLDAAGGRLTQACEHLLRGAEPGDGSAIAWLRRGAEEASSRAPGIAVELYEGALELMPAHHADRQATEVELARVMVASGRVTEAEELCRRVLEDRVDLPHEGALRLALTDAMLRQGRVGDMVHQASLIVGLSHLSERDRARAMAYLLIERLFARDVDALDAAAAEARSVAESSGHVGALGHVLVIQVLASLFRGELVRAREIAAEASEIALRTDTVEAHEPASLVNESVALVACGRLEEARRVLDTSRRTYARLGMWPALAVVPHYAGELALAAGDWDDALAELETATDLAVRTGTGWQVDALLMAALILVRRGRPEEAADRLALARAHLEEGGAALRLARPEHVEALLLEARGETASAARILQQTWTRSVDGPMLNELPDLAPDLLRLLTATGDGDGVARMAEVLVELRDRNTGVVPLAAVAAHATAQATVLAGGDPDELGAAAAHPGARVHATALAHEAAARAFATAGRREDARRHGDAALAAFRRLGATGEADRLRAALGAAGGRIVTRRVRDRPVSGWGALTPSQRRVAELAGQGLSNPEIAARLFVSRPTVATHVSHVLAKLGLRSRVELAAYLARRGSAGGTESST